MKLPRHILKERFRSWLPWVALIVAGLCFIVANDARTSFYRGFSALSWESLHGYDAAALADPSLAGFRSVGSIPIDPPNQQRSGITEALPSGISGIIIHYAAGTVPGLCDLRLSFLNQDRAIIEQLILPISPVENTWQSATLELPAAGQLRLQIEQSADATCNSAFRSRIEHVRFSPLHWFQDFISTVMLGAIPLSLALAAACLWITIATRQASTRIQCIVFLLVSLATQLRLAGYYYWDEWHVLQRYAESGPASLALTHNEHFLPAFFAIYAFETQAFQGMYIPLLLFSCLLHALNTWLVYAIVHRLGAQRLAANILALLFAVSSLHGESLQWAFEQSLLLSHLCIFLSLWLLLKYLESGSRGTLALAIVGAFLAPLFFGNGFVALPYWIFCAALYYLKVPTHGRRVIRIRGALSAALVGAALALVALLYVGFRTGHGHTVEDAKLFNNLAEVGTYIFVGSQVGTVLRGVSLLPSVELGVAPHLIAFIQSNIPGFPHLPIRAESLLGYFAFGVSLLLLVIGRLVSRVAFRYWLAGQLIIVASLALPALGRWQFGPSQSLSLRYHYGSLLGLMIILLPIIQSLFEGQRWNTTRGRATLLLLWLAIGVQLWTAQQFVYFQTLGQQHRFFIDALSDWRSKIGPDASFEGTEGEFSGLQPMYPATLTPGRHPNEIFRVLQWLKGER